MLVELSLLFLVLALLYLIVEAATTILIITGLDQHTARFQAVSIITGTGYTTSEAELITRHPVRRKIAMFLMIIGSTALALIISILVRILSRKVSAVELFFTLFVLVVVTVVFRSRRIMHYFDSYLDKKMLKQPYILQRTVEELLQLDEHFTIAEIQLSHNAPWLDKSLGMSGLRDAGVLVLTIRRRNGSLIRAPRDTDILRAGDILLVYGRPREISEIIELAT